MSIDNSGKRALFTARGDLFSIPRKPDPLGTYHKLPELEIFASWSPNGRYIAYLSDATGEYEVYVKDRQSNNTIKLGLARTEKSGVSNPNGPLIAKNYYLPIRITNFGL